ncbi:MAG: UDP-2,3-diacylglucosamine diphosphatase [Magnetospiraceae bacterium]
MKMDPGTQRFRTLWISDIHLGTSGCQAAQLLDFLKHTECETLYLVGDIVDGWRLKRYWYWPQAHNDIVQKLLRKARKGTKVIFIPGNHDSFARGYVDHDFGDVTIMHEVVHETADGRRLLVIHGDEYDVVVKYWSWLAKLGDWAYMCALWLNTHFNRIRQRLGYGYWSLSSYLKYKVKKAVNFIGDYEQTLAEVARQQDLHGVVCGHIHHPEARVIDGIEYYNDGDWVESCSALAEHFDGRMEIIHWVQWSVPNRQEELETECISSSLPTPGSRKSTVLSARSNPFLKIWKRKAIPSA